MKHAMVKGLTFSIIIALLSSCSSKKLLDTLDICGEPPKQQLPADQKKIRDLKKQLATAEKTEAELSDQIDKLKKEIVEKEATIAIQGKIIALLDDAEQTLQKSIENQIKKR